MRPHRTLFALASIAGLLVAPLALAEDAASPVSPSHIKRHEWCKQNPEKCEEKRAQREAFCQENPQKCEEGKQRRAELKAKCAEDPAQCEAMKQQLREHRQQRHGAAPEPAEPAPAQPAP